MNCIAAETRTVRWESSGGRWSEETAVPRENVPHGREIGWKPELSNAVGSGQCWGGVQRVGVNVGYQGMGIGVGGQGRGPLTPGGTASLSPAVQLSVGVWLSLPEHSAPPSLFPSFQNQQLSHSPRLIPGDPWHLCISKPSSQVSELHLGLAGICFFHLFTCKQYQQLLAFPHANPPCSPRSLSPSFRRLFHWTWSHTRGQILLLCPPDMFPTASHDVNTGQSQLVCPDHLHVPAPVPMHPGTSFQN